MAIGLGVIGCGIVARFHARAAAELRGVKLAACFDRVPAAADRLAEEFGCKAYHDLDRMLADPAVQMVAVATPSGVHLEPALAAARAGKHVIVEKPLEITLRRCDRIIEACDRAGVTLSTILPTRFFESSVEIKRAIEQGRFGRLTLGDAIVKWYRDQAYYDSGAWRGTWRLDGGGALMNQAIHSVDLLTWLMGPVVEVCAQVGLLAHRRIAVEDVAVATLRFANGALGVIEASTAAYPGYAKRIEIHGDAGSAAMEEDLVRWDFAKPDRRDAAIRRRMAERKNACGGAADPKAIGHYGHVLQFQNVLAAIRKGEKPLIDGREGRRSVEIILGMYKSAETGRAVTLPLAADPTLKARKSGSPGS
ncbi:MAG: Gfo/Idh/MocA family oxidoreductase [Thermoguttaceae bacterium]